MNPENCEGTLAVPLGEALNSIQCIRDRVRDGESGDHDGAFDLSTIWESFIQGMMGGAMLFGLDSSKPHQPSLQDGENCVEYFLNSMQALSEAYGRLLKSQDQTVEAMSEDVTNLSLASSKLPQPSLEDAEKLVESFLNIICVLGEVHGRLHKSQDQGMIVGSTLLGLDSSKPPQPSLQDGEKLVESVLNSIQALSEVYDRLHKIQGDHDGAFDLSTIWESFNQAVEAMSEDDANLSLASSKPPQPSFQDGEKLVESVLDDVQALREYFDHLLKSRGVTLWRQVRDVSVEVLKGVLQLVEVIISSPLHSLTQEQITSTRGVWSACVHLARLPKDNKEALLVVLSSKSEVVKDAIEKMKQILSKPEDPFKDCLINDQDDNSDQDGPPSNQCVSLSEKDRQVISACQGLMKTAAACLRKLTSAVKDNSDATKPQKVAQLDDLADISREISASVDDLALCLYPPMNYTGVENHTSKLAISLRNLLELIRSSHVCGEAELTWVQFLEGAVDHNVQKAKELIELDG